MGMRFWLVAGAANALVAVALGAFAAHGLERSGAAEAVGWLETGAHYQLAHGLALVAVALLGGSAELRGRLKAPWLEAAGWAFLAGCLLFSLGLYALALGGPRGVVAVVPVGGSAFLIGWAALIGAALPRRARERERPIEDRSHDS